VTSRRNGFLDLVKLFGQPKFQGLFSEVCAIHLFLALQHLNHVAFGFLASKPNPKKLREYRVFLGDQSNGKAGE